MLNAFRGSKPDLTPAHGAAILIAGIPILANLLSVFGVYDVSRDQQKALEDTVQWGALFGGLLIGGDAAVRAARNKATATIQAAAFNTTAGPPDAGAPASVTTTVEDTASGGSTTITTVDDDVDAHEGDLPTDDDEFAVPPPDELEDEPTDPAVVQPSQQA